jgi:hypothetical protein
MRFETSELPPSAPHSGRGGEGGDKDKSRQKCSQTVKPRNFSTRSSVAWMMPVTPRNVQHFEIRSSPQFCTTPLSFKFMSEECPCPAPMASRKRGRATDTPPSSAAPRGTGLDPCQGGPSSEDACPPGPPGRPALGPTLGRGSPLPVAGPGVGIGTTPNSPAGVPSAHHAAAPPGAAAPAGAPSGGGSSRCGTPRVHAEGRWHCLWRHCMPLQSPPTGNMHAS